VRWLIVVDIDGCRVIREREDGVSVKTYQISNFEYRKRILTGVSASWPVNVLVLLRPTAALTDAMWHRLAGELNKRASA
jgi:hypothetical protein